MDRLTALAPAVDRYVRETYNSLLTLPVPEQLYDLIRSYEQHHEKQLLAEESLKDGTTD
ncbi:hypothetical protein GR328_16280 [Microvirga makkahensis]|uniref:Anti-sigma factor NepR domain-containing protein n=2 Tax=Microvirga makkahensis TaxID=1128670 RepID=A0A7X3MTJ0_9HYPH|nr:hypothetical protein [Microvirga makkahensis]